MPRRNSWCGFAPTHVTATGSTSFWFGIPAQSEGAYGQLTCGWHEEACSFGATGTALDWDYYGSGGENSSIYLRGEGYSPGVPFPVAYSHAIPREAAQFGSTCDWNIVLDVYLWGYTDDGHWLTTTYYVHGRFPSGDIGMEYQDNGFGNPGFWNSGTAFGQMATIDDPAGCHWDGIHVHEASYCCNPQGPQDLNGWLYPSGDISPPYPTFRNNDVNNWTRHFSFNP
jgi:hypothetical protein